MKIFLIIDSLGPGGAEKSMVDLAIFLKDKGHQVLFYCIDKREIGYENLIKKERINILYFKSNNIIKRSKELSKVIKAEKPDLIHSVLLRSNLTVRFVRLFINKTITIESLVNLSYSKKRTVQNNLPIYKSFLVKQFDKWSARIFPSFYHTISAEVLYNYKRLYNIKDNFKIIYRGRRPNDFTKKSYERSSNLISIGRQEFAKGHINILKALNLLKNDKNNKLNLKLTILGHAGKASNGLDNFIQENSLQHIVEIKGFVRDVEKQLSNSDIFIFPSYHEGLGGALIEAMAAGLPCICSDIPVLREVVGDKDGALFFPVDDFEKLADQITRLTNDHELRIRLGQYSYSRYKDMYRLELINNEMLELYENRVNINSKNL